MESFKTALFWFVLHLPKIGKGCDLSLTSQLLISYNEFTFLFDQVQGSPVYSCADRSQEPPIDVSYKMALSLWLFLSLSLHSSLSLYFLVAER